MDKRQEYFNLKVRQFCAMYMEEKEDQDPPHAWVMDDYAEMVCKLIGISDEEDEKISAEAIDLAYSICRDLGIVRKG